MVRGTSCIAAHAFIPCASLLGLRRAQLRAIAPNEGFVQRNCAQLRPTKAQVASRHQELVKEY